MKREENLTRGEKIAVLIIVVFFMAISVWIGKLGKEALTALVNMDVHTHSWVSQNVESEKIEFCEKCGKIKDKDTEHTHVWEPKKVDDEILVICKECGEEAEK